MTAREEFERWNATVTDPEILDVPHHVALKIWQAARAAPAQSDKDELRRFWNELNDGAAPAQPAVDLAGQELENFVCADRFDRSIFADDTAFADWILSRARHTLDKLGGK